jgi:hypothetical protein
VVLKNQYYLHPQVPGMESFALAAIQSVIPRWGLAKLESGGSMEGWVLEFFLIIVH